MPIDFPGLIDGPALVKLIESRRPGTKIDLTDEQREAIYKAISERTPVSRQIKRQTSNQKVITRSCHNS